MQRQLYICGDPSGRTQEMAVPSSSDGPYAATAGEVDTEVSVNSLHWND